MILRDYQRDCVDSVLSKLILEEQDRQLVVMATGLGKTCVFSELPPYFPGQTIVLAHRRKLVKQAAEKLRHANPTLRVEIEQADERARYDADVVVASMQTLAQRKRRAKFAARQLGLVVVDEAHHLALENTYHTILKDFGVFDGRTKLLGVTATPFRSGGQTLADFFQGVAYEKNILDGINEGWLSPLTAYCVYTKTSLAAVGTRGGDFKENELAETVNNDTRNLEIVRAWQKLGKDRRSTLVFAVDKNHARSLVVAFRASDISTELVIDDIAEDDREDIFRRFLDGQFKILVNVGIVTEGVDLPPISCVLLARPTKSIGLVTQMIGRGTRLWCPHRCEKYCEHDDSKRDCLVIDMVDAAGRHKLATSATVLGLPSNVNAKGKDLREVKTAMEEFAREFPGVDLDTPKEISLEWIEQQKIRIKQLMERSQTTVTAEAVNLLGAVDPSVKKISSLTWIKSYDGTLRLRIPAISMNEEPTWVEIRRDASDHYGVFHCNAPGAPSLFQAQPHILETQADALRFADGQVRRLYSDRLKLIDGTARWMKDSATPAQRELVRKMGGQDYPTMTKGDAQRTIDALRSMKEQKALGPCTSRQAYRLRSMNLDPSRISFGEARRIIAGANRA